MSECKVKTKLEKLQKVFTIYKNTQREIEIERDTHSLISVKFTSCLFQFPFPIDNHLSLTTNPYTTDYSNSNICFVDPPQFVCSVYCVLICKFLFFGLIMVLHFTSASLLSVNKSSCFFSSISNSFRKHMRVHMFEFLPFSFPFISMFKSLSIYAAQ